MRSFLSPTFSSGKIKTMFSHFERSAEYLAKTTLRTFGKETPNGFDIPITESMRKYALEVIGTAAFGMDLATIRNSDEMYNLAERIFTFDVAAKLKIILFTQLPKVAKLLGINISDTPSRSFFYELISSALRVRQEGRVKGNDFLQLLVDGQNEAGKGTFIKDVKRWNQDIAVAQGFSFMAAGFDTVANNLATACYMLALKADMQEKLYEEVVGAMKDDEEGGGERISYQDVNELAYLDMFLAEVLRLYPAVSRLDRTAMTDYQLQINTAVGKKSLTIPKGTVVVIPAEVVHRDEEHFPNPLNFDPERFSAESKGKRNPYAYLAFGVGPRNCIGMRFAQTETKVALAYIIKNFVIRPTETTPVPESMEKTPLGFKVAANIQLRFIPRH